MIAIDVHAHAAVRDGIAEMRRVWSGVPDLAPREGGYSWVYDDGHEFGPLPTPLVDAEARFRLMEQTGIDHQVISLRPKALSPSVPAELAGAIAAIQNDAVIAFAEASQGRLSLFASLPMQAPAAAAAEVARLAPHRVVRGVTMEGRPGGREIDDPELERVWAALEQAGLPVQVHPYQEDDTRLPRLEGNYLTNLIGNPVDTAIAVARLIFSGVPDRYPGVRFCFVHAGGAAPGLVGRWDHGWRSRPGVGPDLVEAPSQYLTRFTFDMIAHSERSLRMLVDLVGWDKIVIGTDFPFEMGIADPRGEVARLGLSPEQEAGVLAENAERFLRPR
jgi:aminocarboxymuconate-semialdehyde decarboxylase